MNENASLATNAESIAELDYAGIILAPARPEVVRLESRNPLPLGQYISFRTTQGKLVLGVVESTEVTSRALSTDRISNFYEAEESTIVSSENIRDKSYRSIIRILGLVEELQKCKTILPEYAPLPGTKAYIADPAYLRPIFAPEKPEWMKAGTLLRQSEVDVKINVDKLLPRHLAILAMTGMGKSNLVSLIAKKISEIPGSMVILDYHDEYSKLRIENANYVKAVINPRYLSVEQFADLLDIRESSDKQRTLLTRAFTKEVRARIDDDFWDELKTNIEDFAGETKEYKSTAIRLKDKIDETRRRYSNIIDVKIGDPVENLKESKINIINLIELTDKQANVAVSFYLGKLLEDRKRAANPNKAKPAEKILFTNPVLCVLEEAHVFLPKGEFTDTKDIASKIAREGRKFGIGLVVVSQRPRSVDSSVLSQMGSLAIMKLIQPEDQQQVTAATESVSAELVRQLPSLNPGEALFTGQWVNLTAFVRIEEVKDKIAGTDPKPYSQWINHKEMRARTKESASDYIPEGYVNE